MAAIETHFQGTIPALNKNTDKPPVTNPVFSQELSGGDTGNGMNESDLRNSVGCS